MSELAIDLSMVIFRSFQYGDIDPDSRSIPNEVAGDTAIVLDEIRFRANRVISDEEEEQA